jgi:sialate O-acetylesterase
VAGEDKTFHHALARILGKTSEVEIWCDAVKQPVAARYGWSNLPAGTLLNGRELPAYPFRTDSWPLEPHQSTGAYVRGAGR